MKAYLEQKNKQGTIFNEVSEKGKCPCGSRDIISSGHVKRQYKDLENKILHITRSRYRCNECGKVFYAENDQIDTENRCTTRYTKYIKTGKVLELKYKDCVVKEPEPCKPKENFPTVFNWSARYPFKWVQNRSAKY